MRSVLCVISSASRAARRQASSILSSVPPARRIAPQTSPLDRLTPRQREILQLIAEGRSTKQIAETLSVSVKTVETHRQALMGRLEIYDVPGLVRYAIRVGMVTTDL